MDKDLIKLCKYHLEYGQEAFCSATQRIGVLCDLQSGIGLGNVGVQKSNTMHWVGNTACCAGLKSSSMPISKIATNLKAIVSLSQKGMGRALKKEEAMAFYDILINHTPYGDCIIEKDIEFAYEYGLILDPTAPSRIIAGTLMAQRLAWEYVFVATSMIHYAKLGVNKSVSFLLGHTFSKTGDKTNNSGHCCLNSNNISHSFIKNFVLGKFTPDAPYSEQKTYKYNVSSTFNETPELGDYGIVEIDGAHISTLVGAYAVNREHEGNAIPNPFAKSFMLKLAVQSDKDIVAYFEENLADILGE